MNRLLARLDNKTETENLALTNRSSLSSLVDLFYHAPARRGQDNTQLFHNAFLENDRLAVKAAFYIRDIRGGKGERETFRQFLRYLCNEERETFLAIIPFVPEYGRWDDILEFVYVPQVVDLVRSVLEEDIYSNNPSLISKWLPSINTSSDKTVSLAKKWIHALKISAGDYRKTLSDLRKKIDVVERKMSANKWNKIIYERVPSKAMLKYRKAFSRRDADRFLGYLGQVEKGVKKINTGTLYPYELVSKYLDRYNPNLLDQTIEQLWKNLPNYCNSDKNALVVCDTSGSMYSGGFEKVAPINISISLALYFAERNKGAFKDYFITFSGTPKLQKVVGKTLLDRVLNLKDAEWAQNTNIQAVFELILETAKRGWLDQTELPEVIFIISDMQFDQASARNNRTNFESLKEKFKDAGYQLPKLVFWNVASRVDETPVTIDDKGVYLVSGCSPDVFKSAINTRAVNPLDLVLEILESGRYSKLNEIWE